MRVLVTGGAGLIGSHFLEHFPGEGGGAGSRQPALGLPTSPRGFGCEVTEGSILDRDTLRKAVEGVDYISHLMPRISVLESMDKPITRGEINTHGTLLVFEEVEKPMLKPMTEVVYE